MIPTDEVHHFFRGVQTTNQYYVLWIIPSGKHIQKAIEHSRNSGLTMIYPFKKSGSFHRFLYVETISGNRCLP